MNHFLCCGNSYSNYKTTLNNINQYSCATLRLFLEAIYNYEPGLINIVLFFMNNKINKKILKERIKQYKTQLTTMVGKCFVVKVEKNYGKGNIDVNYIIMRQSSYINSEYYTGLQINKYKNNINSYIHRLIHNSDLEYWCYYDSILNWYKINFKDLILYKVSSDNIFSNNIIYYAKIICISPLVDLYKKNNIYKMTSKYRPQLDLRRDLEIFPEIDHDMRNKILGKTEMTYELWRKLHQEYNLYNHINIAKQFILDDDNKKIIRVKGFYDETICDGVLKKHFYCFPDCDCSYFKNELMFVI